MALLTLTQDVVRQLLERAPSTEVRDLLQPGLSIRGLGGPRPRWYFRYATVGKTGTKVRTAEPLCLVQLCEDPDVMRQVVAAGRAALRENRDPGKAAGKALAAALKSPANLTASDEHGDALPSQAGLLPPRDALPGEDITLRTVQPDARDAGGADMQHFEALKNPPTDSAQLNVFRARLDRSAALERTKQRDRFS